ncbi:hypothetical protein J3R30DRAFT_3450942 [Lentinula aciculospora]|uniref:Uncharacterized protein n=1 Tax=Lentinula aciculospora TaxID=153920 RepID=A0A9W9AK75_9AGAR|nr:hypothetical protein J3R30DRAFT_3450942 [Lentinula aciculospora]
MRLSTLPAASIWSLVLCLFSLVCATPLPMSNRSVQPSSTSVKHTDSLQARELARGPYILFSETVRWNDSLIGTHRLALENVKHYYMSLPNLPTSQTTPPRQSMNVYLGHPTEEVRSKVIQNFRPCCPSCDIILPSDWRNAGDNRGRHAVNCTKPEDVEFPGVEEGAVDNIWTNKCL